MNFQLFFLLLSVALLSCSFGIDAVLFPATLALRETPTSLIGLASIFEISAGIIISFFLSRIVAKFGVMRAMTCFATFYAASVWLIFYANFALWLLLIFTIGTCWFSFFTVRQSWINMVIKNENRGMILAIVNMTIYAGMMVGPILVKFFGIENHKIFAISASLMFASFLALLPIHKKQPKQIESHHISLKKFFRDNPRSFIARFFLEIQTDCLLVFGVIFGQKLGFKIEDCVLLISAFTASGFLGIIVGFLIKKFDPKSLINFGFIGCLFCFLSLLFFTQSYFFLLTIFFIFGFFVDIILISSNTIVNSHYPAKQLVAANSTFQSIAAIGTLFGSLIGGIFMQFFDANGFIATMIFSSICYLLLTFFYEKKFAK